MGYATTGAETPEDMEAAAREISVPIPEGYTGIGVLILPHGSFIIITGADVPTMGMVPDPEQYRARKMDAGFPADAAGAMMIECHIDDCKTLRFIPIPRTRERPSSPPCSTFTVRSRRSTPTSHGADRGRSPLPHLRRGALPWHRFISTWATGRPSPAPPRHGAHP